MIALIVVRPQPGCDATLAKAREMGLDARGFPLFEVRPTEWQAPDPQAFDALLVGSANALRNGGAELERMRSLPVLAVGETTAEAARERGFAVAATGAGGMQALLDRLGGRYPRLLRLSGHERVDLVAPSGVSIVECEVYASKALPLPMGLAAALAQPCVVALHSAAAARHFAQICETAGIARAPIALVALGPRIAQAAGTGWAQISVADRPDDAALLAKAAMMCQKGDQWRAQSNKRSP